MDIQCWSITFENSFNHYYYDACRLHSQLTQSSSSQGRLEQIVSERDAQIQNYEKKIASLSDNSDEYLADVSSLRSQVTGLETQLLDKDKKLSEMDLLFAEQQR